MSAARQQVRIIAGQWRSRRLDFNAIPGLRPTPDRVRETLFNWLAPSISNSHCLDLFAGSGALSFEAASRGAAQVVMVEKDRKACQSLQQQIDKFAAQDVLNITNQSANAYIKHQQQYPPSRPFDIIFLDPPFASDQLNELLPSMSEFAWVAAHTQIYVESAKQQDINYHGWQIRREKTHGNVRSTLLIQ